MDIKYQPIGIIHTPFKTPEGMPIQPPGAEGIKGTIEIFSKYGDGLQDLSGFSHILLLYHFHKGKGFNLHVVPFMDSQTRGVFSTRAPKRPNPIGLSLVKLEKVAGRILHIENVDILDGTPLLDIKPYVPEFDKATSVNTGWLKDPGKTVSERKSDKRFK
jgi:tRNA-Thr(GGU) m(6)t(6)A37 methyltransferase TsaA